MAALLKKAALPAGPAEASLPAESSDLPPALTLALTDVSGVGPKLARKLELAGYDSVARLSRSQPRTVAAKVEGLSLDRAEALVVSARELVRRVELERVTGVVRAEPRTRKTAPRRSSAKSKKKKTRPSKKEAPEPSSMKTVILSSSPV